MYLRFKMKEPESFAREGFVHVKTPYWLALKFYGPRLCLVAGIWFIYDFLTYPFSIYSSAWIDVIQPDAALWQTFGWYVYIVLVSTIAWKYLGSFPIHLLTHYQVCTREFLLPPWSHFWQFYFRLDGSSSRSHDLCRCTRCSR